MHQGTEPRTAAAETALRVLYREITALSRRARSTAARTHPELSLVSFTLLSHLEDRGGCTATDLAAHYALDKSTVSRQVAALEKAGFVERRVPPEDHRVQVLQLTAKGTAVLGEAMRLRGALIRERLADWPEEDLERFAGYLVRYNDAVGG
ncbi:MarR family winged helix-turn-helix transcriptional regulator [Streptomyces physcomitrii]|uniref:Winged helix-turn-helix transcriptional regulator n=1 Tax=Streptomyces physcomitrii TaxID=2724184 RepID=A0ABX1H9J0_9ACTN|nr:MarR family winged helix-turn-helix transcriptional regulator [Streptomyces physcomitrii]NKI43666.1 winged helix-turn-helix transcriptional regulator [Streptomyces physcomitrii]